MSDATRRRAAMGLVIFAIVGAVFAATYSFRSITDTDLNGLQTRSLVLHGNADLQRYRLDVDRFTGPGGDLLIVRDGHQYSVYGIGVSLVAAPAYALLVRLGA